VTDMKMPRVNGLEVINRLHIVRPQLPVILISGFLTPELAIQAERLGAYGCVVKPLDPAIKCVSGAGPQTVPPGGTTVYALSGDHQRSAANPLAAISSVKTTMRDFI